MSWTKNLRAMFGLGIAWSAAGLAIAQTCTGDPSGCGQWGAHLPLKLSGGAPNKPMQAIHALLLPNGKVLCIDGYNTDAPVDTDTHALLFNPADGSTQLVSADHRFLDHLPVEHMLFCSGHARLPDGRLVFRGGNHENPGNERTTIFDPNGVHPTYGAVGMFIQGPDELWQSDGDPELDKTKRWYPTCSTLSDGRVLITDGWSPIFGDDGDGDVPVILQPNSGAPTTWTWQPLYLAKYNTPTWNFDLQLYPLMYQLKNGQVFMAGSH